MKDGFTVKHWITSNLISNALFVTSMGIFPKIKKNPHCNQQQLDLLTRNGRLQKRKKRKGKGNGNNPSPNPIGGASTSTNPFYALLKEGEEAEEGEISENITTEEENTINEGENREALEIDYSRFQCRK